MSDLRPLKLNMKLINRRWDLSNAAYREIIETQRARYEKEKEDIAKAKAKRTLIEKLFGAGRKFG